MEETGWNGPNLSPLAEGPKPPEKKSKKRARVKTSWAELVSRAPEKENSEQHGLFADKEKDQGRPKKPNLEASLLGIQKEEVNTQKPNNSEVDPIVESLDKVAELSSDEKLEVVKQISREGHTAAIEEQSGLEPGDPNLAAAHAAEKFHEALEEQAGSDIVASLDAAEAQAIEQVLMDIESDLLETKGETDENAEEVEAEDDHPEDEDETTATNPVITTIPQSPVVNTPSPPLTPNLPPTPPIPPLSHVANPSPLNSPSRNFNDYSAFGDQSKHSHWPYVLTGGVVGYLIGRRKGRINAEDKLMPIQKALESEVHDLQWQIAGREAKVRALAYERAKTKLVLVDSELGTKPEPTNTYEQNIEPSNIELTTSIESPLRNNSPDQDRWSVEHGSKEDLTAVVNVSRQMAERAVESRFTNETDRENSIETKDISTMNSAEIMQLAKSISVEGIDLWKMYKFGRLTEFGLRKVVSAYLNGEDIDLKLRENLQEYESIERYPTLDDSYSDRFSQSSAALQSDITNNLESQEYSNKHLLNSDSSKDTITIADTQVSTEETGVTESIDTDIQQSIIIGAIIGFCIAVAGILMYLLVR